MVQRHYDKALVLFKGQPVLPIAQGLATLGLMYAVLYFQDLQGKEAYIRPNMACLVIG
jgi:hypothetical protein